ncbi:MAG TPA: amino acid racemase [Acidobacteriota bacterium]|nr:amino acid racemase [Acidobacteriota bacterium]
MNANQTHDRIVGILGGMGPEATADLFRELISLTPATKDQDHIRVLIYSNPKIPDRTRAIVEAGEDPLPALVESAMVLEAAGARILAIPCNAAHHFVPQLQARIGIPILDMIEETCRAFLVQLPNESAAGLLAATGTVRSGIYSTVFRRHGVEIIVPPDREQKEVQCAIQRIKAGNRDPAIREFLETTGNRLADAGAEAVILGCTEIPLQFGAGNVSCPVLNPTRILAQAAVDWALGKRG